ncbi:glycosyltransferase [Clostridium sp. OM02-18AC]|nr:glycosyltransferase [Clostridium sp. OM02-18AC]
MTKKYKVSIIMGIYNGEKTMDTAIESISSQSFKDWELIVCDDASQDNTWEKLQAWSQKDSRIKAIRNSQNLRLAGTLNKCLSHASGKYIARMDDDDISYPQRLEEQVSFLETHLEYAFVGSQVDGYDGKRLIPDYWRRKEKPQKKDFLEASQFIHPSVVFRKEALLQVNGYRAVKETRRAEDYDLFMRLYAAGLKGYNLQKPLLRYYIDDRKTSYQCRMEEVKVRYQGFKQLGLMPWALPYVIRPLLVGLIPKRMLRIWKQDLRN